MIRIEKSNHLNQQEAMKLTLAFAAGLAVTVQAAILKEQDNYAQTEVE